MQTKTIQQLTLSTMGLQPYYNTTEKMKRTSLNSHALEKLMKNLFQALQKESFEERGFKKRSLNLAEA